MLMNINFHSFSCKKFTLSHRELSAHIDLYICNVKKEIFAYHPHDDGIICIARHTRTLHHSLSNVITLILIKCHHIKIFLVFLVAILLVACFIINRDGLLAQLIQ